MMNTYADKSQKPKSKSVATPKKHKNGSASFQLMDKRSEAVTQRRLQRMANESNQVSQLHTIQEKAHQGSLEEKHPIQKKPNHTGLPDNLKTGIENLSGYSMDDVKVHYNSAKPAQLNAHAYAQGTNIHLASGQEKHLPHEAWHVVQQKQGRVQPTMQMKGGANVNDDVGLEKEADVMGGKAVQQKSEQIVSNLGNKKLDSFSKKLLQRVQIIQRVERGKMEVTIFNRGRNQHIEMLFKYLNEEDQEQTVHAHLCGWGPRAKSSEKAIKTAGSGSGGTQVIIKEGAKEMWEGILTNCADRMKSSTVTIPIDDGEKALEYVKRHSGEDGEWPGQFSVIFGNLGIPWFVNCHTFALNTLKEGGVVQDWNAWLKSWISPSAGLDGTGVHYSKLRVIWNKINKACEEMLDELGPI